MSKEAMTKAIEVLKKCHYYMIDAGLPNQSMLIDVFTAYKALEAALAEQPAQQEPVALAQEVIGCFHAAEIEGLTAALANTADEHLKDLVERRLMHALYAAQDVERKSK